MNGGRSLPILERRPLSAHPEAASEPAVRYTVDGLCCATEARQIEAALGRDPRVTSLRIDPVYHTMDVVGAIPPKDVSRSLRELGMEAHRIGEAAPAPTWWELRGRALLAGLAGVLFGGALVAEHVLGLEAAATALAVAAVGAGGWYVFPKGFKAARNLALDMNFLMSTAAVGALAIGEASEAASVMFLFAVAQLLESRSMDRARSAIRALMEVAPAEATVVRAGGEVRVPVEEVRVGEVVVVRPGERIAVDGTVRGGRSAVDQAPITGESVPVDKGSGDEVFAGSVNGEGVLEVATARPASDTTLARIIHAVEEAQASRAPSQTFVERFARIYTPAVVAAAGLLAVAPPLLGLGPWSVWIYRALALLVVACPCALVISTPVTVVSALAGAARRGILIKGGLHLEKAAEVRVVAFDKTGTLTEGRPEVATVIALAECGADRVLALAAAAESRSEHPLAAAVVRRAAADGLNVPAATDTRAIAGKGVEAWVEGRRVLVGSPRLFTAPNGAATEMPDSVRALESEGLTVMLLGEAGPDRTVRVLGVLGLADRLRGHAPEALRELRASGIRHIAMLTGDNPTVAAAVAAEVPTIDEVQAGLLPADKVAAVKAMGRVHGPVLMVGDGINDAPALATADTSVAMGAAGTDVAIEVADIALMGDDLRQLPVLLRLARKAESIIRTNIAFALLVKAAFVVLAVAGLATLWMAVLADMGASLLVIGNGVRASRAR